MINFVRVRIRIRIDLHISPPNGRTVICIYVTDVIVATLDCNVSSQFIYVQIICISHAVANWCVSAVVAQYQMREKEQKNIYNVRITFQY